MIKIYKDFFDESTINFLFEAAAEAKRLNRFRVQYYHWKPIIVQYSAPVLIFDIPDKHCDDLNSRLKEIVDYETAQFMFYFWSVDSYIPWHDDAFGLMTGTVYLNKEWDRDWGGAFLYESGKKIYAEYPEYNKLLLQTKHTLHSTTPVVKPLYHSTLHKEKDETYTKIAPVMRTTLQFFIK